MSVRHTYTCDGPRCNAHITTAADMPGGGFLTVTERTGFNHEPDVTLHFCTWDCAIRHGATLEPAEYFDMDGNPIDKPEVEDA